MSESYHGRQVQGWEGRAMEPATVTVTDLTTAALIHPATSKKPQLAENAVAAARRSAWPAFVEALQAVVALADRYEDRHLRSRNDLPAGMREIVEAFVPGREVPQRVRNDLLMNPDPLIRLLAQIGLGRERAVEPDPPQRWLGRLVARVRSVGRTDRS